MFLSVLSCIFSSRLYSGYCTCMKQTYVVISFQNNRCHVGAVTGAPACAWLSIYRAAILSSNCALNAPDTCETYPRSVARNGSSTVAGKSMCERLQGFLQSPGLIFNRKAILPTQTPAKLFGGRVALPVVNLT